MASRVPIPRCPNCGSDTWAQFLGIDGEVRMQDGTRHGYVDREETYRERTSCVDLKCGWSQDTSFPTRELSRLDEDK